MSSSSEVGGLSVWKKLEWTVLSIALERSGSDRRSEMSKRKCIVQNLDWHQYWLDVKLMNDHWFQQICIGYRSTNITEVEEVYRRAVYSRAPNDLVYIKSKRRIPHGDQRICVWYYIKEMKKQKKNKLKPKDPLQERTSQQYVSLLGIKELCESIYWII